MDEAAELIQRRSGWLVGCGSVLGALALLAGWLWWATQGFDPGDTLQVTTEVQSCGRLHVAAGGEEWQSDQHAAESSMQEGELMLGELRRVSQDRAEFVPENGAMLVLERIRSDRLVRPGCSIPEAERAVLPQS
ncbi:MAG: hypothetical protein JJE52_12415 [Acidimicrobiia bacterium]|nr:hypothetical protein [Acidimicrobiia bacterium]